MPRGVKTARSINRAPAREFVLKTDGQDYGVVTKVLGNGRVLVRCGQTTDVRCTIRGNMRRREWVNLNDVVLVAWRDFGDQHDIIRRYTDDEIKHLTRLGELSVRVEDEDDHDVDIVFEETD